MRVVVIVILLNPLTRRVDGVRFVGRGADGGKDGLYGRLRGWSEFATDEVNLKKKKNGKWI